MTEQWPTEQCRTCHAPIIWTTTDRGRPMPVDAQPARGGNVALRWAADAPPDARPDAPPAVLSSVVKPALAYGRTDLHLSHFVKCPHADRWRRPARRPA